jgi:hypothetical protein
MISVVASCAALVAAIAAVLLSKRTFLTLARTEEILARTDRSQAEAFQFRSPERAAERMASAARHDALAVKCLRMAWPWKPKEPAA